MELPSLLLEDRIAHVADAVAKHHGGDTGDLADELLSKPAAAVLRSNVRVTAPARDLRMPVKAYANRHDAVERDDVAGLELADQKWLVRGAIGVAPELPVEDRGLALDVAVGTTGAEEVNDRPLVRIAERPQ